MIQNTKKIDIREKRICHDIFLMTIRHSVVADNSIYHEGELCLSPGPLPRSSHHK